MEQKDISKSTPKLHREIGQKADQLAQTTNVKPSDLNYDHYTTNKYDQDIINSIPYHKELHEHLIGYIKKHFTDTD